MSTSSSFVPVRLVALSKEERHFLSQNTKKPRLLKMLGFSFLCIIFFSLVIFGLTYPLWVISRDQHPSTYIEQFLLMSTIMGSTIIIVVFYKSYISIDWTRCLLAQQDLNLGFSHEIKISISRVFEIEESSDGEVAFLLELNNNKVLCLSGQYFEQYSSLLKSKKNHKKIFFQKEMIYRFAPQSGFRLSLKGIGSPIETITKLTHPIRNWEDGKFYDGTIETIL